MNTNFVPLLSIDNNIVKAFQRFFSMIGWKDYNVYRFGESYVNHLHLQFTSPNGKFIVVNYPEGKLRINFDPSYNDKNNFDLFLNLLNLKRTLGPTDIFVDIENKLMMIQPSYIMVDLS